MHAQACVLFNHETIHLQRKFHRYLFKKNIYHVTTMSRKLTIRFDIITNSHNEKQYKYVQQIIMIYASQNMVFQL